MNWSDEDQLEAIDWLSQAGCSYLTRAGVSGDSLEKRFAHYHRILGTCKGKIEILPGGGLTWITVKPLLTSWA